MNISRSNQARLYAFGTIVLWASAFVLTKVALGFFTAPAVSVLRYLFASFFLLAVAGIKKIGLPLKKDIPKFFLSGAMGFTFYMITFNEASKLLTATTGSIIIATTPIITAILASLLFKEKITRIGWLAVIIEFCGILILTLWDGVLSVNRGIF